ncbi:MAG TPA: FG-GAP-like repeat-containing protein [Gammaproteobacteria bacterium]|nr:FG-GAP-like repeat-containing protein [Gammaproteobacteria bacterium]
MKYLRRALFTLALLAGILALFSSDAANLQYSFTQGAAYPTGFAPDGVAVGDLNGDGVTDVVTADAGSNSMSVLLGNKDGTFQPRTVYQTGRNPSSVALADLKGNGKLDAIVTNNDDNTITIWWGNGDGTFGSSTLLSTGSGPHRIAVGDIDGDGHLDIAVVNWTGTSATIFYGDGNGNFTSQTLGSWGAPDSIALGDLNGDGKLDIVIGGERETVYLNLGSRQFKQTGNFQPGFHSDSIVVKDITGNGKGDVISVSQHEPAMNILYGNGDGTLDDNVNDIITYSLSGGATNLILQDVNGDGIADAIVSYGGGTAISMLIGTADGHFLARSDSAITGAVDNITVAKLNSSSNVDLIGTSSSTSSVWLFYGNPGIALAAPTTFTVGNSPTGIAVGDLNGDGNPDLVTANTVDSTISVLLGSTSGSYGSRTDFSVGLNASPRRVKLADFNDDGHVDAATANSGTGNVTVLLGTGTGIFGNTHAYAAGTSPTDLVVANLNGAKDTKGNPIQDIAVADPGSGAVLTLVGPGDGTFTPGITLPMAGTPFAIAAGDLEGTGHQDLVVSQYTAGQITVLHNDGAGNFTVLAQYAVGTNPDAITIGDFNNAKNAGGSPILDIAVANFGSGSVTILMNNGSGAFTVKGTVALVGKGSTVTNVATSVQPVDISTADINGDGLPDLITTNNEGSISVLLGDGQGDFNSQSTLVDNSGPAQTVAADMNGDGRLDLATADKTTSAVTVRLTSATNVPVANDVSIALDIKNASFITGTLSANSPSGTSVVYKLLSNPANGSVVLQDSASGTFKYTPNSGFTGTDTFTYEALNGTVPSNQATVSITVSDSGGGGFNWLLVVLLAGFAAWRRLGIRQLR